MKHFPNDEYVLIKRSLIKCYKVNVRNLTRTVINCINTRSITEYKCLPWCYKSYNLLIVNK